MGDLTSVQSEGLASLEVSSQLHLSKLARKKGNLQAAVNAITAIGQLDNKFSQLPEVQDEFCQILYDQGQHALAIRHVENLKSALDPRRDVRRMAVLLGRSAHWNAQAKLKSADEICRTFDTATDLAAKSNVSLREQGQLAYNCAVFFDQQLALLAASPELERLRSLVARKKAASRQLETSRPQSPHSSPSHRVDHDLEEERAAKRRIEEKMSTHLCRALESYAMALAICDDHDDSVIRLCSLWLEHDTDAKASARLTVALKGVSSHKFIVLGPQLAARLYSGKPLTKFNSLLNATVLRLAREHPYHILYQVITLATGVPKPTPASRSKAAGSIDGRGAAAAEIMQRLLTDEGRPVAAGAAKHMTTFAKASVAWCNYGTQSKESDNRVIGKLLPMPKECSLRTLVNLNIPIATVIPPIDLTLVYANVPTLRQYVHMYKLASGIHRPSIMTVVDSLGQKHVQLVRDHSASTSADNSVQGRRRSSPRRRHGTGVRNVQSPPTA